MSYLKKLFESILTEEVNITKISDAIRKRKPVRIKYEADDEPKGKGERIIHPVAYGVSKAGNIVLRAFQPYGDTKTKVPHWKLFRVDKINSWDTLWKRSSFNEPPGQFIADGKYNPEGDKGMTQVYLSANFQNSLDFTSGKKGQGLMRYNKQREMDKLNNDPLYKFKNNLKNSVIDKKVTDRVNRYPSQAAKKYTQNDSYIDDMNSVNNSIEEIPQTIGPIEKGDVEKQRANKTTRQHIPLNNKPVFKKDEKTDINTNDDNENLENNDDLINIDDERKTIS